VNMPQYYVYVHCLYCLNYVNYIAWTCSLVRTQAVDVPYCSIDCFTHNVFYIFYGRFNLLVEDNLTFVLYKCSKLS
jgi:hypothetical protein